ncbi:ABC transporter permease [Lachnospiraceae bacterium]|uniref:carbohydrate ABC transporter permease n=1 Tax=Extibacter sp. GGCC_0201 TaxID=2731209 RepID=UPI001FB7BF44|nr:carbohydrate ABC transporter permease [Extibacter sp. GGCC_0201]BDF32459.1 ABC transporter permease [Lachnospiraceae bacterium]BDF36469.1 ABC transporter permease [Lachnospiraceae bacterium]
MMKKKYHYVIVTFLSLFSAAMMYPMAWMLMISFKTNADIRTNKTKFFPEEWTLEGYKTAFAKAPIGHWFANSMFITVCITAAVILTSTLIGYVFAKYQFRAKKMLFVLLLATMMVPPQVTMIPRYLMIQKLHLFNTKWALIVPALVSAFSIYLAKQFIADVPDSLCEAAKMDGAGPLRIYWSVILPNIKPAIGSIGIFTAMANWNDYLNPLLMLNDIDKMTLPLGLVIFDSQRTVDLSATMAAAAMIMMPMIVIFILFQKQFIKGMTLSGMK